MNEFNGTHALQLTLEHWQRPLLSADIRESGVIAPHCIIDAFPRNASWKPSSINLIAKRLEDVDSRAAELRRYL